MPEVHQHPLPAECGDNTPERGPGHAGHAAIHRHYDVVSMIAHMESEDLQSAFNLLAAPAQSLPYFASSWHLGEAGTGRYPLGLALGRGLGAGGGQDTGV